MDVAEKRLELKEESEKARLPLVKEKRSFKRFDLLAVLAVLGVMGVLLFESIFIFELYVGDASKWEPYLPTILKSYLVQADPEAEEALDSSSPIEKEEPAPAETDESVPVEVKEPTPIEVEESLPVG